MQVNAVGRPLYVYCNFWSVPGNLLAHEVQLTDVLLALMPDPFDHVIRGPQVDKKIRYDASIMIAGTTYLIELDTAEETLTQLENKFRRNYARVTELMLFVTTSQRRIENVRRVAAPFVADIALFAVLPEVLAKPSGVVWTDCSGERTALPELVN